MDGKIDLYYCFIYISYFLYHYYYFLPTSLSSALESNIINTIPLPQGRI